MFNFADVTVQVALISGISSILAAAIAAICALVIGKKFINQKKLRENLIAACTDIEFLLAVEQIHCNEHYANIGESQKLKMRAIAKEGGFEWTGRFTPGRVKSMGLNTLEDAG